MIFWATKVGECSTPVKTETRAFELTRGLSIVPRSLSLNDDHRVVDTPTQ